MQRCHVIRYDPQEELTRVLSYITTGQFGSKHDQVFRTGFIKELVFTVWIGLTNTNVLMKFVRNA